MAFEKKYNPKIKEEEIRNFWEENKIYKFNPNSKKPIYSIDTPPPTLSGKMHIGHAFSFSQQDFIARFKRMTGHEVFYPFGTDDNGLPTEKLVQKERKVNLRKIPRSEAVSIVLDYLKEKRPEFIQDWKNIGMSCDFDLVYSTIDDYSRKISQKSFLELYKKGRIYRKKGPVMWDRQFQTAIAQAELEDKEREAYLNYVKAKVVGSDNTYVIYATTRPELVFAVVGMSVEDKGDYVKLKVGDEYWIVSAKTYEEKFKEFDYELIDKLKGEDLIGQKVVIPVVNKEIEISHDIAVKADFGTGIAYFCTFGGVEDIEWANRHGVEPINLLEKDGRLNELGGKYTGKLASEARDEIIEDMEKEGYIIKKEKKKQIVNVGERSGVEVEFIVSHQWYVKYLDLKEKFVELVNSLNWYPEFMKSRILNWIEGLKWDWGFSRQRHFGIPIPVWYDKEGNIYLPDEEQLPVDPVKDRPNSAPKDIELIPETDVFDTWFTSASSPILASNLVGEENFNKLFPMNLRPQAHDIINFWLFYTIAKTYLQYEKLPFKDVMISGWVLAPDGTKMSKSKGNTIAPQEVVEKYSSDAIRFAAAGTKLGQDIPYQEKEVQTGLKVANKIYNANKFASMLLKDFTKEDIEFSISDVNGIDKWIILRLNKVIETMTKSFENYDFSKARSEIELYFMRFIADNYIEIVKNRLWKPEVFGEKETKKAQKTLYRVLYDSLRLFAPFIPYITEEVYQSFYKNFNEEKSIHQTKWPTINEKLTLENPDNLIELGDKFVSIVMAVRKFKSENKLSMNYPLDRLEIKCDDSLEDFILENISDLKSVTGAKEVIFVENCEIETDFKDLKIDIEYTKEEKEIN
jgi:valyl-tRNA synthetase